MNHKIYLLISLSIYCSPTYSEIFKCTSDNGAVVFQATQCLETANEEQLKVAKKSNPLVGLWQLFGIKVWVKIDSDGNAFQCRISYSNEVFTSQGVLKQKVNSSGEVIDSKIFWEMSFWGETPVRANDGKIYLQYSNRTGESEMIRARQPMDGLCLSKV